MLPPSFRKVFAENDDERVLCLIQHDRFPCLSAFGLSRSTSFEDVLDKEEENAVRRGEDFDRDLRAMQLYGFVEVPFDASGRFILPDHLAGLAGIDDNICFLGGGQFITLWDLDRLQAMGSAFAAPHAACAALAKDARAKAEGKKR
ncbi:division/cell wall cluster transcriptional repressor MraZ [Aurantiacibacter aquimixticola]|uniref:division/cell wall cluster transcriptional repressor MraZ n=1 Tax=Aurantiacibacter aquimixticola TaxID=1958945 RepID=UPI001F5BBB90|nr:division/cell wall cluster transcriptional repressor MraZ [Aurantiacibacter aquimixticola]